MVLTKKCVLEDTFESLSRQTHDPEHNTITLHVQQKIKLPLPYL